MKKIHLLWYVIICMIISSCQKQTTVPKSTMQSDHFADSAVQYLKNKLTPDGFIALNTNSPNLLQYRGESRAVRIFPKDSSVKKFILLFIKNNKFTGHWVDLSHMRKSDLNRYTSTVSLFDLQNTLITRYTVGDNNVTAVYDATHGSTIDPNDRSHTSSSTPDTPEWLDPFVVTPDPLTSIPDYYSAYWLLSQEQGFMSFFIPDYNYTGGGILSISEMEAAMTFPSPKHPIENIKEELKCFTVDNKAVYSVSINVNQPKPGTRDLLNTGTEHEVGHTFITLQQQSTDGSLIIRNIGFYPKNTAKPGSEIDQSTFGDDSETPFCVSLKIILSPLEFNNLQTTVYNQQNINYDLENFNCTTAVMNSFNSVNIILPSTLRHTRMFTGNDPGDLGQDIRELDLLNFSNAIGGKKVVRTVRNSNTELPPIRTGNCK